MNIKWLGHACFLIETVAGTRVVIDPFDLKTGYEALSVTADIVFISHDHHDHNASDAVSGSPLIIEPLDGKDEITVRGEIIRHTSVSSDHDDSRGVVRGKNTIRVIEADGLRICHLGDLGVPLSQKQLDTIGRIDVLFVPVGGVYTIDGKTAMGVVSSINPRIAVPMHYKTEALSFHLETADAFLSGFHRVIKAETLTIEKDSLPEETTVYMLKY